jgi:hypothetical protein
MKRNRKAVQHFEAMPASSKHRGDSWNDAYRMEEDKNTTSMNLHDRYLHKRISVIWKTTKGHPILCNGRVSKIRRNHTGKIEHYIIYEDGDKEWHDLNLENYVIQNECNIWCKHLRSTELDQAKISYLLTDACNFRNAFNDKQKRPAPVLTPEDESKEGSKEHKDVPRALPRMWDLNYSDNDNNLSNDLPTLSDSGDKQIMPTDTGGIFCTRLQSLGVSRQKSNELSAYANANGVSPSKLRSLLANLKTNPTLLNRLNASSSKDVFGWSVHAMKSPDQFVTYTERQIEHQRWHTLTPLQQPQTSHTYQDDSLAAESEDESDAKDPPAHSDYDSDDEGNHLKTQFGLVETLNVKKEFMQALDDDPENARQFVTNATMVDCFLQQVRSAGRNVDACKAAIEQKKQELLQLEQKNQEVLQLEPTSAQHRSVCGLNLQWETRFENTSSKRIRLMRWW